LAPFDMLHRASPFSLVFKWVGTPFSVYGMLDL
jgi:hypothetical protein